MKKKIISIILTFVLLALSAPIVMAEEESFDIYVAPNGSDTATGTISDPLATLDGARIKVRESGFLGKKKINVIFREGQYPMYETVNFNAKDSGTKAYPVTYKAFDGEKVYFDGGVSLDAGAAKEITDPEILKRLNPDAKSHIKVIDLKEYGITEIPPQMREDYYIVSPYSPMRFYIDDEEVQLARWPNVDEEMVLSGEIIDPGVGHNGGKNWDSRPGKFVYLDERIESWATFENVWIWGEFHYAWAPNATAIASVDTEKNIIGLKYSAPGEYKTKKPYYYFNVLEELDVPGEFYADEKTCMLYYYSTGDEKDLYITYTPNHLISFKYAQYINFENFTMQGSRSILISGSEGRAINVDGCTLRYCGLQAINITSGYDYKVNNCKVYEIGGGGIFITAGDKNLLKPSGVRITNNLIYNFSQWKRTYASAIKALGVYDVIANNEIHSGRHMALSIGTGAVAEYNDIYNMLTSSDDAGVIYTYLDASVLDVHFRNNFVHSSSERGRMEATGCWGLYLDGWSSGWNIYNNVFYDMPGGLFINGGQRHKVFHNLFVGCERAIRAGSTTSTPSYPFWQKLDPYDWNKGIWAYKYPELIEYREGENRWTMSASNYICDNLSYDCYQHNMYMSNVPGRPHTVKNNPIITENIFADIENYDFSTNGKNPIEGMQDLDMSKVGRNKRTVEEIEAGLPF